MDKQITLSALNDELSQARTKKKEFLDQIERIIPWDKWFELILPCYYKGERGNKPYDLERMLRMQQFFKMSHKAPPEKLYLSEQHHFHHLERSKNILGTFGTALLRHCPIYSLLLLEQVTWKGIKTG